MSNILVVVYSFTGASRQVAELLSGQQGWQVAHIVDAQPRRGLLGNVRCVLDSLLHRRPEIRYDGPPPSAFDAVVLVSADLDAATGRSDAQLSGVSGPPAAQRGRPFRDGGRGASNAAAEVGAILGREPILSASVTMREVEDGSCAARPQAFGTAIGSAASFAGRGASRHLVAPIDLRTAPRLAARGPRSCRRHGAQGPPGLRAAPSARSAPARRSRCG